MDIHGEGALVQHGPEISQSRHSVPMIQRGAEWQHLCWNGEGDSGRSGWGWQDIANPEGQTERLQVNSTPDGAGRFPLDIVPHGEESLSHWKRQAGAVEGGSSGSCLSHLLP